MEKQIIQWTHKCRECEDEQYGEVDCLDHADRYGHFEFYDIKDEIYKPLEDDELLGE